MKSRSDEDGKSIGAGDGESLCAGDGASLGAGDGAFLISVVGTSLGGNDGSNVGTKSIHSNELSFEKITLPRDKVVWSLDKAS